ncbi:MAG TPA: hypothetical protein VIL92_06345 [Gaiellaceae bacterium]
MTELAAPYAVREARLLVQAVSGQQDRPAFSGRCCYCGARCFGKSCRAHADLLLIEQQETAA